MSNLRVLLVFSLMSFSPLSIGEVLKSEIDNLEQHKEMATKGDMEAQLTLEAANVFGMSWGDLENKKTMAWTIRDAKAGRKYTQSNLASVYYLGKKPFKKDLKKAFYWYMEDAKKGVIKAQLMLGNMYFLGKGIEQNYQKAFVWFEKAAKKGSPYAALNLAHMYDKGGFLIKNMEKAHYWYKKSCRGKNFLACKQVASMDSLPINRNPAKHSMGLQRRPSSAIKGSSKLQENMHSKKQKFMKTTLMEKTRKQNYKNKILARTAYNAAKMFIKKAQSGLRRSKKNFYKKAAMFFEICAGYGKAKCHYNIGLMHSKGLGRVKNQVKAYKWFLLAKSKSNQFKAKDKAILNQKIKYLQTQLTSSEIIEGQELASKFTIKRGLATAK